MEKFQPGGMMAGQTFELDDKWLKFVGASNGYFSVPRKHIETVSISPKSAGSSYLQIIGKGTVLASVELPYSLAEKSQLWLFEKLNLL